MSSFSPENLSFNIGYLEDKNSGYKKGLDSIPSLAMTALGAVAQADILVVIGGVVLGLNVAGLVWRGVQKGADRFFGFLDRVPRYP